MSLRGSRDFLCVKIVLQADRGTEGNRKKNAAYRTKMARNNDELVKDSVGDVIVTLIILAMQKGTNVEECLQLAYDEIKGRTGKMVDGVFVKSEDLER